jgi:hypothetical protein
LSDHGVVVVIVILAERLQGLREEGFLPMSSKARIHEDHRAPSSLAGEVISVASFHERDLSFPVSVFLRGLLLHYGLELHHTTMGGGSSTLQHSLRCVWPS